jgi:hypothetical protein
MVLGKLPVRLRLSFFIPLRLFRTIEWNYLGNSIA